MTSGVMPTSLLCLPVENYMPLAEARTTKAETRTFLRQNRVLFKHLITPLDFFIYFFCLFWLPACLCTVNAFKLTSHSTVSTSGSCRLLYTHNVNNIWFPSDQRLLEAWLRIFKLLTKTSFLLSHTHTGPAPKSPKHFWAEVKGGKVNQVDNKASYY